MFTLSTTLWSAKPHWRVLLPTYNANTHPECFILANLDQSVTKQATAM